MRCVLRTQASLLDRLEQAIVAEYRCEFEQMQRSPKQHQVERVQSLLAGECVDSAELGYELEAEHLGMIGMGAQAEKLVRHIAAGLNCQPLIVPCGKVNVWAWLGGRSLPAIADIVGILSEFSAVSLTIGEPGKGVTGWRITHRQAQAALTVAFHRPQKLTRYADVALLASALKDDLLARSVLKIYLSPLDDMHNAGSVLRQTLRAYIACGHQASSTAEALKMDRRTISKHLRKIEDCLERPLHTCLTELDVALRLEELRGTRLQF